MTIKELVEQISNDDKAILAGVPRNKAMALVRAAFAVIGKTIDETEEGTVIFPGLGQFRVRRVERELEGKPIVRKQVVFLRPMAKQRGQVDPVN